MNALDAMKILMHNMPVGAGILLQEHVSDVISGSATPAEDWWRTALLFQQEQIGFDIQVCGYDLRYEYDESKRCPNEDCPVDGSCRMRRP
jgi:hypothetical protein